MNLGLGLEFINALSPKSYNVQTKLVQEFRSKKIFKEDDPSLSAYAESDALTWCGLIAQDVQALLVSRGMGHANLVDVPEDDTKEVYGMRYSEFVPILINAVNELTARVAVLEGA